MAAAAATTTEAGSFPPPSVSPAAAIKESTAVVVEGESHPLTYKWVLWNSKGDRNDYDTKEITDFETVEQFWSLFNFLEENSERILGHYARMCFFRAGISPRYEDPGNAGGGRIVIESSEEAIKEAGGPMKIFCTMALLAIGHQFDAYSENVCGITLMNKKKQVTFEIWVNPLENKPVKLRNAIALRVCEEAKLSNKFAFKYHSHENPAIFQPMNKFRMNTPSASD